MTFGNLRETFRDIWDDYAEEYDMGTVGGNTIGIPFDQVSYNFGEELGMLTYPGKKNVDADFGELELNFQDIFDPKTEEYDFGNADEKDIGIPTDNANYNFGDVGNKTDQFDFETELDFKEVGDTVVSAKRKSKK